MATGTKKRVLSVGRCGALEQHGVELPGGDGVFQEVKGAVIVELVCGAVESADCDSAECAADADALHAYVGEIVHGQAERDSGEHVDGTVDGAHHRLDYVMLGDTRCEEHVGSGLLERLEATNGFVEIGTARSEER